MRVCVCVCVCVCVLCVCVCCAWFVLPARQDSIQHTHTKQTNGKDDNASLLENKEPEFLKLDWPKEAKNIDMDDGLAEVGCYWPPGAKIELSPFIPQIARLHAWVWTISITSPRTCAELCFSAVTEFGSGRSEAPKQVCVTPRSCHPPR